jgi:hypothetical protein
MNGSSPSYPGQVPIYAAGKEPLPPGFTEEDRAAIQQTKKWEGYAGMAMESCAVKTVLAGGAGVLHHSACPCSPVDGFFSDFAQVLASERSFRLCQLRLRMRTPYCGSRLRLA